MHIKTLKVIGLHGYIDKVINFDEDLTLLVGINGSGKTSILNLINWIIKPSISNLCITEFKLLALSFTFNRQKYIVTCKHNHNTFKYFVKTGKERFNPLSVVIATKPSDIRNDEALKLVLIQQYSALKPDPKEKRTWDLIAKFPKPTIIGLDRHPYGEEPEKIFSEETRSSKNYRRQPSQSVLPLERVKEMVNREYRKRKNDILNLTNGLKNYLMLSTFEGSITVKSFTSGIKYKLNILAIEKLESRVSDYFNKFEKTLSKIEKNKIGKYFASLKEVTSQYQNNPDNETTELLYGLNANQFLKVNKLLRRFERFEAESNIAFDHITAYINTLDYFLKDSAKKITFKEDTAEIGFQNLNKDGRSITPIKDIRFLSSGEQQLLILFSYIAFNSGDGKIFIIDEPELSLHVKWQEEFLEYLEKIKPKSTQLILATHSPILANKKRKNVRVLLPYNEV
jgi:predicted ATPase